MLTSLGQVNEPKVNPRNSNYLHMADDVYVFFRPSFEVVIEGRILNFVSGKRDLCSTIG